MSMPVIPRFLASLAVMMCLHLPAASRALAQRADAGWQPAPLRAPSWIAPAASSRSTSWSATVRDSTRIPRTYWLEGAGIVGALSGLFGVYLGVDLCDNTEGCHSPVPGALAGLVIVGVVGFGVGALIGGQFPES